ncbi:hypothetical protein I2I05_08660 [Hymenobacter sp. BT683]|uniref:Uncharacterized protein n=1 Tax=Hymenobacter jeongseonensis TaxID=2791027 RepID=A0ABS0IGH6_9BACT|nr:hypothetical protein [Hymenobacter jeongseonensis]MBF9237468.1 hypothetical protein [Hymenobacter jeongseonensis]
MLTLSLVLLFLLNLYASISGFKDSILYSRTAADATKYNEHLLYIAERVVVLVIVAVSTQLGLIPALAAILGFALMFSFSHNQSYYLGRNIIDGTTHGFTYSSKSSTAKIEMGFKLRATLFVLGLVLHVGIVACTR